MNSPRILSALALTVIAVSSAFAQDAKVSGISQGGSAVPARAPNAIPPPIILVKEVPWYPMKTCVVCTKALPAKPVDFLFDSRVFRLDADACKAAIQADPKTFSKKVDDAVIATQRPTYPLRTSAQTGKPLDTATTVDVVRVNRLVRLNRDEIPAFDADPAVAIAKIDKAYIDAQMPGYSMTTCPVTGADLKTARDSVVPYLYGSKLVLFANATAVKTFEADPLKYLDKLPK